MTSVDKIFCPTCKKQNTWRADNDYKPFCSARCKLIDLGDWADESHKIPGEEINPENLEQDPDQE